MYVSFASARKRLDLRTATSLLDKLKEHDFTALTEGGGQWVRKALHPAESTIKAPRCPSHGTRPTATQEVTSTFVISAPEGSVPDSATWNAVIAIKNDPLAPVEIHTFYTGESSGGDFTAVNQAFAGTTPVLARHTKDQYADILSNFMESCEQYRVTALSLTGTFVGATLTDQGSIVSAQMSDPHMDGSMIATNVDAGVYTRAYLIGQSIPDSESLILGTSPYVSAARDGFYVPYKFLHPDRWYNTDNLACVIRTFNGWRSQPSGALIDTTKATIADIGGVPYPYGNTATGGFGLWLPPIDDGLSVTWIKSVAKTTTFRLTLRVAIEVMTRPASSLAPYADLPALPDEHAIAMYYEIASRMKDCYPSRDNDSGSLWGKIKNIAAGIWDTVSPTLATAVPQLAPVVSGVNLLRKVLPVGINAVAAKGQKTRITDDNGDLLDTAKADARAAARLLNNARSGAERAVTATKTRRRPKKKAAAPVADAQARPRHFKFKNGKLVAVDAGKV